MALLLNKRPIFGMLGPRQSLPTPLAIPEGQAPAAWCMNTHLLKVSNVNGFAHVENLGDGFLPYVLVVAPQAVVTAANLPWTEIIKNLGNSPAGMAARLVISQLQKRTP